MFKRKMSELMKIAIISVCGTAALASAGCSRNENYFTQHASSRLSGPATAPTPPNPVYRSNPTPPPSADYGAYRGGRDPRTGTAPPPEWMRPQVSSSSSTVGARPTNASVVTVQPGDTLYNLSIKHRVSIASLMSLNGLSQAAVQPGQSLRLR